jgi:hypothetical protein
MSKTVRQQVDEALRSKEKGKNRHAWNKFFGKVQWSSDAVTFQRRLRDE